MNVIMEQIRAVLDFFGQYYWYIPLYWLLGAYVLVYVLAFGLCRTIPRIRKTERPVDREVHLAWGIGFLVHLGLFLWFGLDTINEAWYGPYEPGYEFTSSESTWAVARALPYVAVGALDFIFTIALLKSGFSRDEGAAKKVKAGRGRKSKGRGGRN
ncbi:MAG TPA: hypothetical protein ENN80_01775 [Candidatus Hydrogenedentes bacterium]|nr:hypothetical protein [Candidatus Hydrogenedentota bacterium]